MVCLSESNYEKRVLNIPLTIISYFELAVMVSVCLACMLVPGTKLVRNYHLLCDFNSLCFVFNVSKGCRGKCCKRKQNLNAKVFQMREIINQASELIAMSKDSDTRALLQSVYEAIRYSDPVSTEETQPEECEMIKLLAEIKALIECEKSETIRTKADTIIHLTEQRNNKCNSLKHQRI